MISRPVLAAVLLGLAPAAAAEGGLPDGAGASDGKFTRFEEDETGARLQTGVGSYRNRDGVTVDLIGAIHIGDKAYYQRLNRRFTRYDALLYEMVGESFQKRQEWRTARERLESAIEEKRGPAKDSAVSGEAGVRAVPDETSSKANAGAGSILQSIEDARKQVEEADEEKAAGGNLAWLHPLYETIEKSLGLTGQMNGIDYSRGNFVHADMTLREFAAMQSVNNENFLTLWWKTVVIQLAHPEAAPEQPGLLKIMESLCRQDGSVGLRRIAARTFGSMEGILAGLDSEEGTVILTERNKVALKVLEEQIELGKKNLAIFYGAAHLADLERRLLAMGFVRTGGEWFNAWDMPPEPGSAVKR